MGRSCPVGEERGYFHNTAPDSKRNSAILTIGMLERSTVIVDAHLVASAAHNGWEDLACDPH